MHPYTLEFGIDPEFLPPEPLGHAVDPLLPEPNRVLCHRLRLAHRLLVGSSFPLARSRLNRARPLPSLAERWRIRNALDTGLLEYNTDVGLDVKWPSLDGCITKAPLGGETTGPNPTGRGTCGTKRHLPTGTIRHDETRVQAVFDSMSLLPPWPPLSRRSIFVQTKAMTMTFAP